MENLWAIVFRAVNKDARQFRSISELKQRIVEYWSSITEEVLQGLALSVVRRCLAVLRNNEAKIAY